MKFTIQKTASVLSLLIVLATVQCKKNNDLPPETQTGKQTFGCLVNGKVFEPKGGGLRSNRDCYYQQIYPGSHGFVFHVSGADFSSSEIGYSVFINCDSIKINKNQTYALTSTGKGNAVGEYTIISGTGIYRYMSNVNNPGQLTFTEFDETNRIASGTFSFNAINGSGDTVKITSGRFDMNYTL